MCELFAFSGEHPALLQYSLRAFAARGGGPRNADGWGVAHYVDGDVRLVKEAGAASDSACMSFIESHPLRSELVVSHIRHATQGVRAVRNSQPFVRELGGAMHVFAHNGDLARDGLRALLDDGVYRPVGDTDSELAFCALLHRLRRAWDAAGGRPPLEQRRAVVEAFARDLRALGPANFLYADGDALFAHGHKRIHPGEGVRPPGLHLLCRQCQTPSRAIESDGLSIRPAGAEGAQTLIASVPLTDDPWRALAEGELVVVRSGRLVAAAG